MSRHKLADHEEFLEKILDGLKQIQTISSQSPFGWREYLENMITKIENFQIGE